MERTYEWEFDADENVLSQHIIPTKKKTPIFRVRSVKIQREGKSGWPTKDGSLVLTISGGGMAHSRRYHDGTVWVWQEKPL